MLTATPWYYLPQFRPARLQDCVLWLEADSFNGGVWRNLAPNFSDRNHGTANGDVGLSSWHPLSPPAPTFYGNEYINCGNDSSLISAYHDITIEVWFITDSLDSRLVEKGVDSGWGFFLFNGRLYFGGHWGNSAWTSDFVVTLGRLYHAVAIGGGRTGSTVHETKFYVDGVQRTATNNGDWVFIPPSTEDATICYSEHTSNYGYGVILSVRIFGTDLTYSEIRHNYTHHPLYYLQRGIDPYQVISAATAAATPLI